MTAASEDHPARAVERAPEMGGRTFLLWVLAPLLLLFTLLFLFFAPDQPVGGPSKYDLPPGPAGGATAPSPAPARGGSGP